MTFQAFGTSHLMALLVIFALAAIMITWGRGVPSPVLGVLVLLVHIPYQTIAWLPKNYNIQHSIPLHLCDLAWMVCAVALITQSRWSLRLIYYWGLTLTPQALLTPALAYDFPHLVFFGFWLDHGLVFICTLYIVFVLKFRPALSDFKRAYAFTLAWGLFVLAFNSKFGTNYMFLNSKPPKSVLDLMGPWPMYLVVEALLVGVIWYVITPNKERYRTV